MHAAFETTPHVFLASRVAGDIATLRGMNVPPDRIWAVEADRDQCLPLFERQEREKFKLFCMKVETLVEGRPKVKFRSTYLDFCGNLEGEAKVIRRVVPHLPRHSVLSVTLFLGREHDKPEDREDALHALINKCTDQPVTVIQEILYVSSLGATKASPMGTWTFYLGPPASKAKMRFNLHACRPHEMQRLATTPSAINAIWQTQLKIAVNRSKGAVKANLTRAA
jgi:hypothetical protein